MLYFVIYYDVHQHLRVYWYVVCKGRHAPACRLHNIQYLNGRQHAVAGGVLIKEYYVSRLLAAYGIALLEHLLQHVPVSHLCFGNVYAKLSHALLKTYIGHDGHYQRILFQPSFSLHRLSAYAHYPVAVHYITALISCYHPVRIAVKGKSRIGVRFRHQLLQSLRMGRSALVVYVYAVRLVCPGINLCAKLCEYVVSYL